MKDKSSQIDWDECKRVISFMKEHGLHEFEFEKDDFSIKISFAGVASPVVVSRPIPPQTSKPKTITSPLVGTFYRAPSPGAPSYVEVGTFVSKGQVVGIVEAMKLMNEIESELEGVIHEVLVQDGEPVEFGQDLFSIRPKSE